MKNIFENVLGTIGNTPVVQIKKLAPEHVNLCVKNDDELGIAKSTPNYRFNIP
ncbi:MAG: hypothetical protein OSB72_08795 [Gammaproteobacteria bacterium]|nr:hypothetical protein [Gammaproteobacteria bacterium]